MTTLTITLYLEDEPGKDSYELAKEIHSQVYNSESKADPTMTIGKDYIVLDLHASKCYKKAPQSVLKAVSDSLDVVYSEGSKQVKNEKYSRVSYIPYERKSYLNKIRKSYGFPEYSYEGSTLICKVADLQDPTSKGYKRLIEECSEYLSAMGHTKPQKHK